ncbi:PREDICTED: probable F-box protein At4g22030 [Nelumbo nucifera]|uniref:F-box protein At4g22030 n=2 Tax=Nelumbo nucifera TaxID=4432 RepID=A0A822XJI5_NELNU|nr:PREDICTED: probable F-box protein At4g22030 [Nelumbo nucifera]DAD20437.1 TPA_asm: hypothetical protein HUJ06_021900 [Nelumbo nucifera]
MSTLQASTFLSSSPCKRVIQATLHGHVPKPRSAAIPKLPARDLVEELMNMRAAGYTSTTTTTQLQPKLVRQARTVATTTKRGDVDADDHPNFTVIAELYEIMEATADRAEMHANIEKQRNNWNNLFLTSINSITIAAATMAALAATCGEVGTPLVALKLSSTLLYSAATGMLLVINKIQPSQLAEEQRNAARLFKQLNGQIRTILALGNPTAMDVKDAMEKVLALDKAYPLPLLGTMLDKFPATVEPSVWWPQQQKRRSHRRAEKNGWSGKLEEEMKQIVEVLKRKDIQEYVRLSKLALKVSRILAITGPLLTGLAAVGSALVGVGSPLHGSWAVFLGVVAGVMASVVNTLEHGGQVGMVFEMYRSSAGFFRLVEGYIKSTLKEGKAGRRENAELFEMRVALQLGRSISELRDLAASSSASSSREFASKLF